MTTAMTVMKVRTRKSKRSSETSWISSSPLLILCSRPRKIACSCSLAVDLDTRNNVLSAMGTYFGCCPGNPVQNVFEESIQPAILASVTQSCQIWSFAYPFRFYVYEALSIRNEIIDISLRPLGWSFERLNLLHS